MIQTIIVLLGLCWFVVSGVLTFGAILEVIVNLRINETLQIGAFSNRTASAQLETAPTGLD